MVLLAQVSDLHIDGGEASVARAERVMGYLADLPRPVDAVLVTGDVADHGAAEEYRAARRLLAAPAPVLACPGNHDQRANFRRVLLDDPGGDGDRPVNQVHHLEGLTVVLCDSTVPGQDGGYLADETIAWLDAALAATPDRPVLVAMHHPPVTLGIPFVDGIRQEGGHRLGDVLARHRQVVAVLCGHGRLTTHFRVVG
jgi:3',5'-cyclic-AMP phosphodiesterase